LNPNIAYRDRHRRMGPTIIDVRHLKYLTMPCACCGKRTTPNLRGVSNLDLSEVKCCACREQK
jgi:hypothetical protein